MSIWNPWHGCRKISPGCAHCYVYRRDESIGKDASVVTRTGDFNLPLKKTRQGAYKLRSEDGIVLTCMTSDFFLPEADEWRVSCWDMIRRRADLRFYIITKRIDRFAECAPPGWGGGWEHVSPATAIPPAPARRNGSSIGCRSERTSLTGWRNQTSGAASA